ncbi:MAG: lipopolysaccharide biosynthesis protein [Flavobacteriales bacterium]|tara:strand:+ start:2486 stop:3949 length:1464 start_codon:yes stop_codon:yes gene_type:complete
MGIIAKQSFYNVLSIAFAFCIGAANMLFLYPKYPGKEFQGLIVALLANSNLIQPFISFGFQHTLIKYFSDCKTDVERDRLLWFAILFPILILAFILPLYGFYNEEIFEFLSNGNKSVLRFPILILSVAVATAYFEIFFSWLRVHLKSVFGNFLKEVYPRMLTLILLVLYAIEFIDLDQFIVYLIAGYYLRLLIIITYCFKVHTPSFQCKLPDGWQSMLRYSSLIFLSGAAASFILDIDKSMIYSLSTDENVAFYAVALYIAAVIEAPGRAMFQITSPLVAKALNENNEVRLVFLLKKSSLNLMIVCALVFLMINLNLSDFYLIINQEGYASAANVVIIVSLGKFFSISMGCLNNIISNSKYYFYIFWFSISSAILAVILNYIFIQSHGIIGAAIATLIVIVFINLCKIILVAVLFKIHPYSKKSIEIFMSTLVIYGLIYWIPTLLNPILSITARSILIIGLFSIPMYLFRWSSDIESAFKKISSRLF